MKRVQTCFAVALERGKGAGCKVDMCTGKSCRVQAVFGGSGERSAASRKSGSDAPVWIGMLALM